MKILVVDDEALINQYVVQCIRDTDSNVQIVGTATSGESRLAGRGDKARRRSKASSTSSLPHPSCKAIRSSASGSRRACSSSWKWPFTNFHSRLPSSPLRRN